MIPKLVAFDLDGTLAISKSPLAPDMTELLSRLTSATDTAITSGGKFEQFKTQVIDRLPADTRFDHLHLLPTSGAAYFSYTNGAWTPHYQETLSEEESTLIRGAIVTALTETNVMDPDAPLYGEQTEYRGSQVTFSALGQEAPVDAKYAWDPDQAKRRKMAQILIPLLPDYDVKIGGATSIDITKKGINKAFGIRKLSEFTGIAIPDMLYIGDALFPGGNDEVVKETGIPTRQIQDPTETARVIKELLGA